MLLTERSVFAAARINSVVRGVTIGAQSYSFRDRSLEAAITAWLAVGLSECELTQGHVAPVHFAREALRK